MSAPLWAVDAIIYLHDGSQLTGNVQTIDLDGSASIKTIYAQTLLALTPSSIAQIDFSDTADIGDYTSEQLTLHTGEMLPCSVLSLNKESIEINTWYAGKLSIPYDLTAAIKFHATPELTLYRGPNSNDLWIADNNWNITDHSLTCTSKGKIATEFDLPKDFILSSTLSWSSAQPRFSLKFCADTPKARSGENHYFLEFSTYKVILSRSSALQKKAILGEFPLKLKQIDGNSIDLELKVNRSEQTITILINGKKMGIYDDMSFRPPRGNVFAVESTMQGAKEQLMISNINLHLWNGLLTFPPSNNAQKKEKDSFINRNGGQGTGEILAISAKEKLLLFQSSYSQQPLRIPLRTLETLHFSNSKQDKRQLSPSNYSLSLRGNGTLSAVNIMYDSKTTIITHPQLGEISLAKHAIKSLTAQPKTNE